MTQNITWHKNTVARTDRLCALDQKNYVLWLTGLSGSGKSTIATLLEEALHSQGKLCYILDGDNLRHGLNKDLGFSDADRQENIRRVREVAKILYDAGVIVIVSFISPFQKDRNLARERFGENFHEVYIRCSLQTCEERDTKGLYKKARAGTITDFTGIDSPYEAPECPELVLNTDKETTQESLQKILVYLENI